MYYTNRYNSEFVGYVKQKVFGAVTKINPPAFGPPPEINLTGRVISQLLYTADHFY